MKILALVEDLRVNKTSAGIRRANILKTLLNKGHSITCIYDYFDDNSFPWLSSKDIKFQRIESLNYTFLVKLVKPFYKSNAFSNYLTGFNFAEHNKIRAWKKAIKEAIKNDYDFILVLGAGNSNMNFFAMSNINTNIPYIVNYHDPYPTFQYPKPYAEQKTRVGVLKAKKSNKVMQKAYKVSFPSQRLYEWMLQYHPILKEKSFILPHVYTPLENLPSKETDNLVNLNTNRFNILHIGSLLGPRNPKVLLKVFQKFIKSSKEKEALTTLNIIGSVAKNMKDFDVDKDSKNLNFIKGRVSYVKSLDLIQQADALLILEANAVNNPFMPGKLADYLAMEKPIMSLTPQNSEVSRIFGKEYPLLTQMDNEEKIYEVLEILWQRFKNKQLHNFIDEKLTNYVSEHNFNRIFNQQIKYL